MIHVAVVDDDDSARVSLKSVFEWEKDCRWAGGYADAETALASFMLACPQVVVIDIGLPGMDGIECLRRLKALQPHVKVIIWSGLYEAANVLRSVQAGADGFLCKSESLSRWCTAIRDVVRGEVPMCPRATGLLVEMLQRQAHLVALNGILSSREQEVLDGLNQGLREKEIAEKLEIGLATVHTHVSHIHRKLNAHSREEVLQVMNGYLPSPVVHRVPVDSGSLRQLRCA